jgi:tetratricopeptide (TPR) repeat protein
LGRDGHICVVRKAVLGIDGGNSEYQPADADTEVPAPLPLARLVAIRRHMRILAGRSHRRWVLVIGCGAAFAACESSQQGPQHASVEQYLAQARAATERNDLGGALDNYDQAVMEVRYPRGAATTRTPGEVAGIVANCRLEQTRLCVIGRQFLRATRCADEVLAPEQAATLQPTHVADAQALRAFARWHLGQREDALADHAAAKRLSPGSMFVLAFDDALSGRTDLLEQARGCTAKRDWKGALEKVGAALQLREDIEVLRWRAMLYEQLGKPAEALADRRRCVELSGAPSPAAPPADRALSTPAAPDDRTAIERILGIEHVDPWLGEMEEEARREERFARDLEAFGARNGWNDFAGLEAGCEHLFACRHVAAEAAFSQAITAAPGRAVAWFCRAVARIDLGRFDDAIGDCSQAIHLAADNPACWQLRAVAHEGNSQPAAAIADLDKAIELRPEAAGSWAHRGRLLDRGGEEIGAVRDYQKALALGATDAWLVNALARVKIESELAEVYDPVGGLALAKRLPDLMPGDPWFLDTLACAHAAAGDFAAAEQVLSEAIRRCKDADLRSELDANRRAFQARQTLRERLRAQRSGGQRSP